MGSTKMKTTTKKIEKRKQRNIHTCLCWSLLAVTAEVLQTLRTGLMSKQEVSWEGEGEEEEEVGISERSEVKRLKQ